MAATARSSEDKKEYFDSPEEVERKALELAGWIQGSKHMIAFTGAGISTAAGIPDFRSGMDTQVETGPGVWELRAQGKARSSASKTRSTLQAIPTKTHMMLVELVEQGLLKAIVSQNCDGLHRRSGLRLKALFELHGNSNVERCKKCKREYLRDDRVRNKKNKVKVHLTGRTCDNPSCGGMLVDTIINFGENLPQKTLDKSYEHAGKADLCLAMGSSLTVTPAAEIPEIVGNRQRLVIVNLQNTPLDHLAALRVYAKCDDFTQLLMEKLKLETPHFQLRRSLIFNTVSSGTKVIVEQVDAEGNPFSYLKLLEFGGVVSKSCPPGKGPLECEIPPKGGEVRVNLSFQAHYGEPDLSLCFQVKPGEDDVVNVQLSYDPSTGRWSMSRSDQAQALAQQLQPLQI